MRTIFEPAQDGPHSGPYEDRVGSSENDVPEMNMRIHIRDAMVLTLVLGVGAAALLNASESWAIATRMFVTVSLFAAILGVIYRTEKARATWAGFLVFGWGYALLCEFSPPDAGLRVLVAPGEYTERLLDRLNLAKKIPIVVGQNAFTLDGTEVKVTGTATRSGGTYYRVVFPRGGGDVLELSQFKTSNEEHYYRVGHSLMTLVVALVGAVLARWFYSTNGRRGNRDGAAIESSVRSSPQATRDGGQPEPVATESSGLHASPPNWSCSSMRSDVASGEDSLRKSPRHR